MKYVPTIGLEVHVQLRTASKMFCGCRTSFGADPNTNVCPVCLGYPGAMPVINEEAVKLTVVTGLMLGSNIGAYSKFDRKSYFYPDMPKNYQISQYDKPLCIGGSVAFDAGGTGKTARLCRIHLEEDVGKSTHMEHFSIVDFNRAGSPLMEIVTEPDLRSADDAIAFLAALKQILLYARVSDCNLEEGNMRCDVNCSVSPEGSATLGTKTEIKNLNTFKGVYNALQYEIARQIEVVSQGGKITQETRRWDPDTGATYSMRSKEEAHDYRYFPEPDLLPVVLSPGTVEDWRKSLPELPALRRARFQSRYGLPGYDAGVLVADRDTAEFFEAVAAIQSNYKAVSNWIMTDVLRVVSETGKGIAALRITPKHLADLISMVDGGTINSSAAREVFGVVLETGQEPGIIVSERGLSQVSDTGAIDEMAGKVIAENAKSAEDYKSGKKAALQYLVGQVMKLSKGKANPAMAMDALKKRLDAGG